MGEKFWTVTLHAFAFETKEKAIAFREAIEDAATELPSFDGYGCSTRIDEETEDDPKGPKA